MSTQEHGAQNYVSLKNLTQRKNNEVRRMKKKQIQAYKQTPWRVQLQWIGLFLLGLILVAAITGIYLSINAQAAGTSSPGQ